MNKKKFTLRLLKLGRLKLLNSMMLKLHEQIMFVNRNQLCWKKL